MHRVSGSPQTRNSLQRYVAMVKQCRQHVCTVLVCFCSEPPRNPGIPGENRTKRPPVSGGFPSCTCVCNVVARATSLWHRYISPAGYTSSNLSVPRHFTAKHQHKQIFCVVYKSFGFEGIYILVPRADNGFVVFAGFRLFGVRYSEVSWRFGIAAREYVRH